MIVKAGRWQKNCYSYSPRFAKALKEVNGGVRISTPKQPQAWEVAREQHELRRDVTRGDALPQPRAALESKLLALVELDQQDGVLVVPAHHLHCEVGGRPIQSTWSPCHVRMDRVRG